MLLIKRHINSNNNGPIRIKSLPKQVQVLGLSFSTPYKKASIYYKAAMLQFTVTSALLGRLRTSESDL